MSIVSWVLVEMWIDCFSDSRGLLIKIVSIACTECL